MDRKLKARFAIAITMLALAFIGMIVTSVHFEGGWVYWKWIVPVYAGLALWLSWYIRRDKETFRPTTLGHELLHWIGVVATVFLVSFYVKHGVISRFIAGVIDLTILSLGIFLAGVYIEATFLLIGVVLGIFAALSSLVVTYLYAAIIPIVLIAAILVTIIIWIAHRKTHKSE